MQRPPIVPGARTRFRTVAIKDSDPFSFARKHEQALNELTSEGWSITGMMDKGGALIITGQKVEITTPQSMQPQEEVPQGFSMPQSSTDQGHVEIVYTYIENGKHNTVRCSSMPDAVRRVRAHIDSGYDILPSAITVMSVVSYEPLKDLKALERFYSR